MRAGEGATLPPLDGAGERPLGDTLRILNKQNNANCDEIIKETNQQELGCLFRQMAMSVTEFISTVEEFLPSK